MTEQFPTAKCDQDAHCSIHVIFFSKPGSDITLFARHGMIGMSFY
jgi:hypothetical protein